MKGSSPCGDEELEEDLNQTKPIITPLVQRQTSSEDSPDVDSQVSNLRGSGQPLPASTRSFFEPRFGYDIGRVRVHTDSSAAEVAQSVNARAFTLGRDIVFSAGQYAPGTNTGKRLLAHELSHVVQQTGASKGKTGSVRATIQRMLPCPLRLMETDPTPSGWKSYQGDPSVFHCGFRGILEDRIPTANDLQNECFYDHSGALVDENHPYAGCRGTPNRYDSREYWGLPHAILDPGGIVRAGIPAFITSRFNDLIRILSSAIEVVETAGRVSESIIIGFGEFIALGVLTARATVDPQNWSFQGLPARSRRHLNMMGMIIGSSALSGNVDNLLRNLTRRLDSFGVPVLLDEIAQDVTQALQSRGADTQQIATSDLGEMSLLQLIDWLQIQGIVRYSRPPEDIAREQLTAETAEIP